MSEHTTKTDKVVAIPHEERTQVTIDTLGEVEHVVMCIKFDLARLTRDLKSVSTQLAKLRLVLEAK